MLPAHWLDKPYYSLNAYLKSTYGHKCYKIALDAHMTCPNRDGTLGRQGCLFCSAGGSGDFAVSGRDIDQQLQAGLALFGEKQVGQHYIAYFQAYTNTYGPPERLHRLYVQALEHPLSAASPSPPGQTASLNRYCNCWLNFAGYIRINLYGLSWDCRRSMKIPPVSSAEATNCPALRKP